MNINPFKSPDKRSDVLLDANSKLLLARVRPAVLFVAVASVLFTIGSVLSATAAMWFYYPTLEASNVFDDPGQMGAKRIVMFAIFQQLIMACGFGYLSLLIFKHAKAIRSATAGNSTVLDEVFTTQRSCWYMAGILSATFIFLRIISALIPEL